MALPELNEKGGETLFPELDLTLSVPCNVGQVASYKPSDHVSAL